MVEDAHGRLWQVATIQLDMTMPERFDLTCVNEQGEKERIVMVHAAITGSIERFLSVLIEHLGGAFPLWLSPVQVRVLPVSENTTHMHRKCWSFSKRRIFVQTWMMRMNRSVRKYVTPRQKKSLTCSLSGIRKLKQKCLGRRSRPREIRQYVPRGFCKSRKRRDYVPRIVKARVSASFAPVTPVE